MTVTGFRIRGASFQTTVHRSGGGNGDMENIQN